ncbi:MAG TPA: hypothetical protein VFZ61_08870, partial [Polyangiales bacterium]
MLPEAATRRPPYGPVSTLLLGLLLAVVLFLAQLVATALVIEQRAGGPLVPSQAGADGRSRAELVGARIAQESGD